MEQYKAEQRAATGELDPASLRAQRRVRVAKGRERQKRVGELGESLALGVGFPLLFGAGGGSIGGSLAGSFFGKGFGGQILGGAIGAKVDEFLLATTELATGLTRLTSIFDTLKEKSLISSRALEKQIERTEEAGFSATANAAAQRDFTSSVGAEGANNLVRLGEAADLGSRQWAIAVARIQSQVAGPLGAAQNFLAKGGQISNLNSRAGDLVRDLDSRGQAAAAKKLSDAVNPFTEIGKRKTQDQVIAERQAAIKEAESKLPPLKIKLDAKQVREELITSLEKELQGIDLARSITNQIRGRAREQEDLDQQRAELVLQNERAIADLRQSIEDKIADARLSNLQRENELYRVQGEIRAKALANSTRNLGTGATDSRVNEAGSAIADYLQKELEIANDAAAIKRDAALEVNRIDVETERFKLQVATQLIRMEQDSAKRVADINKGVRRSNQDQDNRKFELEKQIAVLRLQSINAEAALGVQMAGSTGQQDLANNLLALQQASANAISYTEKLKPPAALREIGRVGVGGATTGGLEAVNDRAKELINSMAAARQDLLALAQDGNLQALQERLNQIFIDPLDKAMASAKALFTALNEGFGVVASETAADSAGLGTLTTGLDDLNKKVQDNNKLTAQQKDQLSAWIKLLQEAIPENTKQVDGIEAINNHLKSLNEKYLELQDALEALKMPYGELTEVQKVINDLTRRGIDLTSAEAKALLEKAKAVDKLKTSLSEAEFRQKTLNDLANQMGTTLNDALGGAIDNLINKTQSWQSVLSDVLGQIGSLLLNAGISLLGGNDGVGFFSFLGGNLGKRAAGGPINAGQPYLVGEQGPELVVPNQSGTVLNAQNTRTAARTALTGGSGGGGSVQIGYTVTEINSMRFVSEDQFQQGMEATRRAAAREGAAGGERRTLDRLRQSPKTRRSLGL